MVTPQSVCPWWPLRVSVHGDLSQCLSMVTSTVSVHGDLSQCLSMVTPHSVCPWWPLTVSVHGDLSRCLSMVTSHSVCPWWLLTVSVHGDLSQCLSMVTPLSVSVWLLNWEEAWGNCSPFVARQLGRIQDCHLAWGGGEEIPHVLLKCDDPGSCRDATSTQFDVLLFRALMGEDCCRVMLCSHIVQDGYLRWQVGLLFYVQAAVCFWWSCLCPDVCGRVAAGQETVTHFVLFKRCESKMRCRKIVNRKKVTELQTGCQLLHLKMTNKAALTCLFLSV